ncbi:MAG TPA: SDR family oxidoreductase [Bacteroidales bacterium]|nr:SDR family oxidoreductase [Bacteroidales bacterium]
MDLGSTKDVAALSIFLLSEESKWITGQNIVIDGGYSCQ